MLPLVESIILATVARLLPFNATGRPRTETKELLNKMVLVLESGMSWRHLGQCTQGVDFRTVHRHFISWSRMGVFRTAYQSLIRLHSRKSRRSEYHCMDSSYVKSIYGRDCIGRNPTDRGRRATKLSAIVDSSGIPISLVAFPANTSDYKTVDATLLQRLCPTQRPCPLYADKGYDSKKVRHDLSHAGYIARVSQRRVSVHRVVNQRRGVVERFFSWLDKNRRLIVRYDAYIASYMSWTWLACCKILGKRM